MKEILKTSIYCLLIALLLAGAYAQVVESHTSYTTSTDRILMIKGMVARDMTSWLIVEARNGTEWKKNGFDPIYTHLICNYKPLFRRLPTGQWEIMFQSEIAKDIP